MHIVKHSADPISAMIRSKDGNTIAISTITTTTRMRIRILADWRMLSRTPFGGSETALGCSPSPHRISTVATRGRELIRSVSVCMECQKTHLNGTLVIGMIEMKIIMQMDRKRGYSFVTKMLPVISSRTASPNISQPIIAIEQSRENCRQR
jgi:hypothetical protein